MGKSCVLWNDLQLVLPLCMVAAGLQWLWRAWMQLRSGARIAFGAACVDASGAGDDAGRAVDSMYGSLGCTGCMHEGQHTAVCAAEHSLGAGVGAG